MNLNKKIFIGNYWVNKDRNDKDFMNKAGIGKDQIRKMLRNITKCYEMLQSVKRYQKKINKQFLININKCQHLSATFPPPTQILNRYETPNKS